MTVIRTKKVKTFFITAILLIFVFTSFSVSSIFAQETTAEEKAELENQLKVLEKEIAAHEAQAAKYRSAGNTLQSEIGGLDSKISKLSAQIKYISASLVRLTRDIAQNEVGIIDTQDKIDFHRQAIARSLQKVYEQENISLVIVLLQNPSLAEFFDDISDLLAVQANLTSNVQDITALKDELLDEKDELAVQKDDAVTYKVFQESQKNEVAYTKNAKTQLLDATKGEESKYRELAAERKVEATKIRSRLFKLLGGGEMSFEEAYAFAKLAQDATGVTASFLLATLDRESALGKYVGGCTYHNAMAPGPPDSRRDDVTPFLRITADLGLDPETTMVSCPISQDGAYGGAMGPSQFIPTTWILYEKNVAKITGNSPASPWRNSDAFVATALLLRDNLRACENTGYSGDEQIRCAAARYYAGGYYKKHMYGTYGTATLSRKKQFDDDIALITGD